MEDELLYGIGIPSASIVANSEKSSPFKIDNMPLKQE